MGKEREKLRQKKADKFLAESYENALRNARGNFLNWSILTTVKRSEKILDNLILIDFLLLKQAI